MLHLQAGTEVDQRGVLRKLVDMRYERNDMNLVRGKFRVRGDTIEVHPAYEETAVRIELFGDEIERIQVVDPLTGEQVTVLDELVDLPGHPLRHRRRADARGDRPHRGGAAGAPRLVREGGQAPRGAAPPHAHPVRPRDDAGGRLLQRDRELLGAARRSRPGEPPNTLLDFFPDDFLDGHGREPPVACRSSTASTRATAPARSSSSSTASGCRARPTTGRCASRRSWSGSTRSCSSRPRPGPTSCRCRPRSPSRSCAPPAWSTPR